MKNGYIKLHRSSMEHWLYFAEPFTKWQAWTDLLLLANFEETKKMYKGNLQITHAGQLQVSYDYLARRWQWSRSKVYRFLILLETDNMIKQVGKSSGTTITIENWSKFQGRNSVLQKTDKNRNTNRNTDDTSKHTEISNRTKNQRNTDDTTNDTADDTTGDTHNKNNKEYKERAAHEIALDGISARSSKKYKQLKVGDIFQDEDGYWFIVKPDGIDRYRGKRKDK